MKTRAAAALCGTLLMVAMPWTYAQHAMDGVMKSDHSNTTRGEGCGDMKMGAGPEGSANTQGGCCGGGGCGGAGGCGMSDTAKKGSACGQTSSRSDLMDRMGMGEMQKGARASWPALELSESQAAQIDAIKFTSRKKAQELDRQLRREKRNLEDLLAADERDIAAIRAQYQIIQEVELRIMQARLEAEAGMEAVLTTKQREDLRWSQVERAAMQ
jgi:Spy/CpxP family protein refolding chaperone